MFTVNAFDNIQIWSLDVCDIGSPLKYVNGDCENIIAGA